MAYQVLVTAPYLLPVLDHYRPLLEARGCIVHAAHVRERLSGDELLICIGDIDGVICGDDEFTSDVFAAAPKLKVLSKWGTGIDSIDQMAARAHGVAIRNIPNAFSEPVGDTVLGWMLAFARRLPEQTTLLRQGGWEKLPGQALNETTLGVIGVGNCGKAVIRRAHVFGMRVLGNDILTVDADFVREHDVEMVALPDLLAASDYVSLNCDLNPTSRHLLRAETLAMMRETAVLMNSARGPLVCEADLIATLHAGRLRGAALDVFEEEPLPESSPLRSMEQVLLSAHNANSSPQAWECVHEQAIRNLLDVLEQGA